MDWDMIKDSSSESSEESVEWDSYGQKEPLGNLQFSSCFCKHVFSLPDCKYILEDSLITYNLSSCRCYVDNVIRVCNFASENYKGMDSKERLYICDMFYRYRHELMFNLLCSTFNLPNVKSDTPLSNWGATSNRTPDLVLEKDGKLIIIEVSVGSSMERMAMSKGLDTAGFEGKYQKEIDELTESGKDCIYLPFLFSTSDPYNKDYFDQIKILENFYPLNKEALGSLDFIKVELSVLTRNMKDYFIPVSGLLFVKETFIKPDHSSLNFLYSKTPNSVNYKYIDLCVSTPVYNKVINNWDRIFSFIERFAIHPDKKYLLIIDASSHRFSVKESLEGTFRDDFLTIIENNDKYALLKYSKLKIGALYKSPFESETGVKFTEKVPLNSVAESQQDPIEPSSGHNVQILIHLEMPDLKPYEEKLSNYFLQNYNSLHFDQDYEDLFLEKIRDYDKLSNDLDFEKDYVNDLNVKLLADFDINNLDVDSLMNNLRSDQMNLNESVGVPIVIKKSKVPFILPLACLNSSSYCSLVNKNNYFLNEILINLGEKNPYTKLIIENILKPDFSFIREKGIPSSKLNDLFKERSEVSMKITKLQVSLCKKLRLENSKVDPDKVKLSKTQDPLYKNEYKVLANKVKVLSKEIETMKKYENISNETVFIKLPTKGRNSFLKNAYSEEMSHYKSNKKANRAQSTIEGVGYREGLENDYIKDFQIFDSITSKLVVNAGDNPDLFFEDVKTDDCKLLKDLKKIAVDEYSKIINQVKNCYLGHSSSFISRLSHSLIYYSQMPFSSDYIRPDNLGYKNVLLLVKGGKKIFKTKSSKFFRLIYPIHDELVDWYFPHGPFNSSTSLFELDNQKYLITPWVQWHESILNDSLSFYPRIMSFTVLNLNPSLELNQQYHKVSTNILLSFHNRRQTEVLLANMRYILLSTLGDFTGIEEIFGDFLGFNYDCFQSFIRGSILKNYPDFFKKFLKIKLNADKRPNMNFNEISKYEIPNIFTSHFIENENELALMIYSTFLMTKAPYQRPVERANNLKGILSINDYYENKVGLKKTAEEVFKSTEVSLTSNISFKDYSNSLFENDFNFDPKYCANLGVFMDSYFKNKGVSEDFHGIWLNILNQSWDEMATSTGLRGNIEDVEDFWGQKGYFVVYKDLIKNNDYMDSVKKLVDLSLSINDRRKMLRQLNIIYKNKLEHDREFLVFHAVDKIQWRGGREIYVMDMYTKGIQQPIEKFMAEVCKRIDNELISIPSNKRAQVIHHSIFERDLPTKNMLTWYLTLDCSKWAPKSNFLKFIPVILSMSVFPDSFKTHFLNYTHKLFKKRVYFNKAEVEVLKNNQMYSEIVDKYLIKDETVQGFYMLMPYSWVMGIFNYTSSFLHAANQKYFSYILFKSSLKNYQKETSMIMFAHSDDSGGRVTAATKPLIKRALSLYEINLKSCNHLLSKKKSVVSRLYFEILSIIYIFQKLLALLPKFLGGLRFLPTDKGASQDMLQSYSKCIEVMVAGANFNVAYLVMKFYSYMIFRFYYNTKPDEIDFKIPVNYVGLPDAHPLMVLICGAEADIVRLIHVGEENNLVDMCSIINSTVNKNMEDNCFIKPLKFKISIRGLKDKFLKNINEFESILNKWSINNVNFKTTPFNLMSFLKKLNDPGFLGSLVNESQTRRISRAYYIRSGESCPSNYGFLKLQTMREYVRMIQTYSESSNVKENIEFILGQEAVNDIENQLCESRKSVKLDLEVYKHISSSFFKILSYLDNISMEGKKIVESNRTLKPTHIEISKTSKIFSTRFDPAQLVSSIKEPELNWALPNPSGIITAKVELKSLCDKLNLKIEELNPETLLKLVRMYSDKTSKGIYIYSKVPSELKNIRTYTSVLTFLSVNSINNREIHGLVLNLNSKVGSLGYLIPEIDNELYFINNCLSLLGKVCKDSDVNFINYLYIKPIEGILWFGGKVLEFLNFIEIKYGVDETLGLLLLHLYSLRNLLYTEGASKDVMGVDIKNSYFYTFLKSQKSKSGWYGKGEVLFNFSNCFYGFELINDSITKVYSNKLGKLDSLHWAFITDCFNEINIRFKPVDLIKNVRNRGKYMFWFDIAGNISLNEKRYFTSGYFAELRYDYPDFLKNLDYYNAKPLNNDSFLLQADPSLDPINRKIYTLPIAATEMQNVAKLMFDPNDFESKLEAEGISDFEEFLLTEILTQYGSETYIGFEEMLDNFSGSYIYKVMRDCKLNEWSKIPRNLSQSILPANETGLTRILLDYSEKSGDRVIKYNKNLTPEIMSIRSEFPNDMSLVLSEQLIKFHNKIYNENEKVEIYESYSKLSECNDETVARSQIINLLKYWGYGGFVSIISDFNLATQEVNFGYFNLGGSNLSKIGVFSQVFLDLHNLIIDSMIDCSNIFIGLDTPFKYMSEKADLKEILKSWNKSLSATHLNYRELGCNVDYYYLRFLNCFLGFLKDDNFCSVLSLKTKSNLILSSIPFNYKCRMDIIITYNCLKTIWYRKMSFKPPLNVNSCVQIDRQSQVRFNMLSSYKNIVKNPYLNLSPIEAYYNGFLNTGILSKIMELRKISNKGIEFRVTSELKRRSNQVVPITKTLAFPRPLEEDVFDEENWEEIVFELNVADVDEETVLELWEGIKIKKLKNKVTRLKEYNSKKTVQVKISWLIEPYMEGDNMLKNSIRQVNENVVVLSNNIIKGFENFYNSQIRLVDMGSGAGQNSKVMIAHITCDKILDDDFWNSYLGGEKYCVDEIIRKNLFYDLIRQEDSEIVQIGNIGSITTADMLCEYDGYTKAQMEEKEGKNKLKKLEEEKNRASSSKSNESKEEEKFLTDFEIYNRKIEEKLESLVSSKTIPKRLKWRLLDKYCKHDANKIIDLEKMFNMFITETGLLKVNNAISEKDSNGMFSENDLVKVFKSPEHFGMAHTANRPQNDTIVNKKVSAELNSFVNGLSRKIGSDNWHISKGMQKLFKSMYRLWISVLKTANFKTEEKRYLLSALTAIHNCSKPVIETKDDDDWQIIINKASIYMAEEKEDNEDGEDDFNFAISNIPSSRLKYRPVGL